MYRIMQRMETGEEVHAPCSDFSNEDDAFDWLEANEKQYPESTFWVEKVYNYWVEKIPY